MEGRGFIPAVKNGQNLGALAPEAAWLQGLKAHASVLPKAAGLTRISHHVWRRVEGRGFSPAEIAVATLILFRAPRSLRPQAARGTE